MIRFFQMTLAGEFETVGQRAAHGGLERGGYECCRLTNRWSQQIRSWKQAYILGGDGLVLPEWVEGFLVFEHAVDEVQEFSHGRTDHAHFAFASGQ